MKIEFDDKVTALIKFWAQSVGKSPEGKSPEVFIDDCIKEKIMALSDKSKKVLFILINRLFKQHGYKGETLQLKEEVHQSKVVL